MKDYYCKSCYIGAGYGGMCHTSIPEIAPKPTVCPVFVDNECCTWVKI